MPNKNPAPKSETPMPHNPGRTRRLVLGHRAHPAQWAVGVLLTLALYGLGAALGLSPWAFAGYLITGGLLVAVHGEVQARFSFNLVANLLYSVCLWPLALATAVRSA